MVVKKSEKFLVHEVDVKDNTERGERLQDMSSVGRAPVMEGTVGRSNEEHRR
jgi:hypothetical protein